MNDLLEMALDGAGAAYRAARSRALVTAGVAGLALGSVIALAAGRVGAALATQPLTTWLGIQDTHGVSARDPVPGAVLLAAVVALLGVWMATVAVIRRRGLPARGVWWVFAAWAAPFVVGPPVFDSSIYRYTAFALLQRDGHNPYATAPDELGYARIVEAVDPGSRGVPSNAGPLATLMQHIAASVGTGQALLIVLALRAVALLSVVWIGRLAVELGGRHPGNALALTVLNPLLLFFVVSAGRLEGPLAALALAAVTTAAHRSWRRALVLAAAAASVLAAGFAVVLAVGATHLTQRRGRPAGRTLLLDLLILAAAVALFGVLVPDGFGWLRTAQYQFSAHTPFSVADVTGKVLQPFVRGASYDTRTASARLATVIALAVTVCALLATAGRRTVDRTAGYSLLAVGLLAPNLYPWFVIPAVVCLAPRAGAARSICITGLSAAACLLMPGGFGARTAHTITALALTAIAVLTLVGLRDLRRRAAVAAG